MLLLAMGWELGKTFTASPKREKGRQREKKRKKKTNRKNKTTENNLTTKTINNKETTDEQASKGQGSRQSSEERRLTRLYWENSGSKPIRLTWPLTG